MRIRVVHETVYRYERPAKAVIQTLRLTPRSHDGQHVVRWRLDVDQDVRLGQSEDAFGNICHAFTATGSIESLRVKVEGEVETHDNAGVLHGVVERFPVSLYLRDTDLTRTDAMVQAFARRSAGAAGGPLATCHALMQAIHDGVAVSHDARQPAAGMVEALATGMGVAQDLSHLFIGCARTLGIPARYVSGFLWQAEAMEGRSLHAWAEAYVEGLGWVGFDPTLPTCPTTHHIRVAAGLDYLAAAPVRGAHYGGEGEALAVSLDISEKEVRPQAQRQSQG